MVSGPSQTEQNGPCTTEWPRYSAPSTRLRRAADLTQALLLCLADQFFVAVLLHIDPGMVQHSLALPSKRPLRSHYKTPAWGGHRPEGEMTIGRLTGYEPGRMARKPGKLR